MASSGVARPGPTRVCALPSHSMMDQTKINGSANSYRSVTDINYAIV